MMIGQKDTEEEYKTQCKQEVAMCEETNPVTVVLHQHPCNIFNLQSLQA